MLLIKLFITVMIWICFILSGSSEGEKKKTWIMKTVSNYELDITLITEPSHLVIIAIMLCYYCITFSPKCRSYIAFSPGIRVERHKCCVVAYCWHFAQLDIAAELFKHILLVHCSCQTVPANIPLPSNSLTICKHMSFEHREES